MCPIEQYYQLLPHVSKSKDFIPFNQIVLENDDKTLLYWFGVYDNRFVLSECVNLREEYYCHEDNYEEDEPSSESKLARL